MRPIDADKLQINLDILLETSNILKDEAPNYKMFLESMKRIIDWQKTIENQTSWAEAEQTIGKWIPCSERLPEKDGRYQVTRYDSVTNTEFIDILWYEKNIWWNGHQMGNYAVTAWMPLPEPWRREQ